MSDAVSIAKLKTMATMQDEHNCQVHPAWRSQGYAYYRAIWVECAEMLDHYGWKWWKAQSPELAQVKLELVDIWHFGLSEMMRANTLTDEAARLLSGLTPSDTGADTGAERFREAIEALAASSLRTKSFELQPFADAMQALPMDFAELFDLYVGKNVLNRFRQDHGYKSGEYQKLWQGREDNEHLIDVLNSLDVDPKTLPQVLYQALADRYPN